MQQPITIFNRRVSILFSLLLMFVSSCAPVKLISEYDEITDKTVTALQQEVSRTFVKLESEVGTPQAQYENYKLFYQEAKVSLSTLKVRAKAVDKNRIVEEQIEELTQMLNRLETLHKMGFVAVEQVTALKQPFDAAFTAIVKLQMALKRGAKTK